MLVRSLTETLRQTWQCGARRCRLMPCPTAFIHAAGLALTLLVVLALKFGSAAFEDADAWDLGGDVAAFGIGDAAGGLLWALSLWFCTPIQVRRGETRSSLSSRSGSVAAVTDHAPGSG